MKQEGKVNCDCVSHTEATIATFLLSASSMVTGLPSDATVKFRMTLLDPTAIRYLLFEEYARDVCPAVPAEPC